MSALEPGCISTRRSTTKLTLFAFDTLNQVIVASADDLYPILLPLAVATMELGYALGKVYPRPFLTRLKKFCIWIQSLRCTEELFTTRNVSRSGSRGT